MKKLLFLISFLLTANLLFAQNTFPLSGNVGIGTTTPGAKLSFNDLVDGSNEASGITWYNPSPLAYGIYRTPGSWDHPNYQQLQLTFSTGIILNPGSLYGKSYVEIQGGGLRVSSGNVGIGTTTPAYDLDVSSGANTTIKIGSTVNTGYSDLIFKGSLNSWKISKSPSGTGTSGASGTLAFTYNTNVYGGDRPVLQLNHSASSWNAQFGASDQTIFGGSGLGVNGNIGAMRLYLNNNATGSMTTSFGLGSDLLLGVEGRIGARQMFIGGGTNDNSIGLGSNLLLAVDGRIGARGVVVSLASAFPDYVFEPSYRLLPLSEIEKYIKEYGHLPEVPSAEKVEKDGMELGMMTSLMVQKIEELTLHIIEMNKKIEKLERDNQLLKGAIKK